MTIKEFLEEIQKVFEKSGIECAQREAMLLACHILSVDQVYLITHKDEYIDEKVLLASAALINERCKGRPLAYIIGSANFCGVELTVDERVLIPRPETEVLTEDAINFAKALIKEGKTPKVLDLCTGSGCIAAAIAENVPECEIIASDIDLKAYQLANYNLRKYKNVKLLRSDLFDKIEDTFDIIISNPPYVAEKDRKGMQREVVEHEPSIALFSGEDGLDIIRRLIPQVENHLNSGGLFVCEMVEDQVNTALEIARQTEAFCGLEIKQDLADHPRYIRCIKK